MQARSSTQASVVSFFAVACGLTWLLAAPLALSWIHRTAPPPYAIACAGLSAFGPLFAVLAIAGPRGQLRGVFTRWRADPRWVVLALLAPMAINVVTTALSLFAGDQSVQWLHPPPGPEQVAALVVFPVGEEFGWRGFAYPRLVERFGVVKGSLVLGVVWGVWHLAYSVTPTAAAFDPRLFAMTMAELPLYSLLIAWVFERANRSMFVAIAFHAGGHLDHIELAPLSDFRLHGIHLLVLAVVAALAARSLSKPQGAVPAAA